MKVQVWKDERYPDFGLSKDPTYDISDVSDEFWAEYQRINKLYNEMQNKLEALYKARS